MSTRFIFEGNKKIAMRFLGRAKAELELLKHNMSFYELQQGFKTITLNINPKVIVYCVVTPLITVVTITAEFAKGKEKKRRKEEYCWCSPCFTFGVIQSIDATLSDSEYTDGTKFDYSVMVCIGDKYVLLTDGAVVAAGWEEYYVGQYVLVGNDVGSILGTLADCCVDTTCLAANLSNTDKLTPDTFCIYPLHVIGEMREFKEIWIF